MTDAILYLKCCAVVAIIMVIAAILVAAAYVTMYHASLKHDANWQAIAKHFRK